MSTVSFSIDPLEDADIRRWLDSQPDGQRSQAIRRALRDHIARQITLGDVLQAIERLERKIETGTITTSPESGAGSDEPDRAVAALSALANL